MLKLRRKSGKSGKMERKLECWTDEASWSFSAEDIRPSVWSTEKDTPLTGEHSR